MNPTAYLIIKNLHGFSPHMGARGEPGLAGYREGAVLIIKLPHLTYPPKVTQSLTA